MKQGVGPIGPRGRSRASGWTANSDGGGFSASKSRATTTSRKGLAALLDAMQGPAAVLAGRVRPEVLRAWCKTCSPRAGAARGEGRQVQGRHWAWLSPKYRDLEAAALSGQADSRAHGPVAASRCGGQAGSRARAASSRRRRRTSIAGHARARMRKFHQTGTKKMPARPFLPPPDPAVFAPLMKALAAEDDTKGRVMRVPYHASQAETEAAALGRVAGRAGRSRRGGERRHHRRRCPYEIHTTDKADLGGLPSLELIVTDSTPTVDSFARIYRHRRRHRRLGWRRRRRRRCRRRSNATCGACGRSCATCTSRPSRARGRSIPEASNTRRCSSGRRLSKCRSSKARSLKCS